MSGKMITRYLSGSLAVQVEGTGATMLGDHLHRVT
jgi:hypothetical protein